MDLSKVEKLIISKIEDKIKNLTKFKLADDIIKVYPYIEYIILNAIKEIKLNYNILEDDSVIIEHVWKNLKISGISLEIWKDYWKKNNSTTELTDFKTIYKLSKKNNLFKEKQVEINIYGLKLNIKVLDTGTIYIPSDEIIVTKELLSELKKLKEKEKIEHLATILEEGFDSIPLTLEERHKVDIEIDKRVKERLFEAKKELDELNYDLEENSNDEPSIDVLRDRLFDAVYDAEDFYYKLQSDQSSNEYEKKIIESMHELDKIERRKI